MARSDSAVPLLGSCTAKGKGYGYRGEDSWAHSSLMNFHILPKAVLEVEVEGVPAVPAVVVAAAVVVVDIAAAVVGVRAEGGKIGPEKLLVHSEGLLPEDLHNRVLVLPLEMLDPEPQVRLLYRGHVDRPG